MDVRSYISKVLVLSKSATFVVVTLFSLQAFSSIQAKDSLICPPGLCAPLASYCPPGLSVPLASYCPPGL